MPDLVEFGIQYEGLRELLQALRVVEHDLYLAVVEGLRNAGEVIRRAARSNFVLYGASSGYGFVTAREEGFIKAADGFDTRVRPNLSTYPILSVGQSLRRTGDMPRRRSNFGGLMMRHALLPARSQHLAEAGEIIDREVTALLRSRGF